MQAEAPVNGEEAGQAGSAEQQGRSLANKDTPAGPHHEHR